jgi:hypothetical protein
VLEAKVSDTDLEVNSLVAATSAGLFTSKDQGKANGWVVQSPVSRTFVSVQALGAFVVVAATRSSVLVSEDAGKNLAALCARLLSREYS